jgi:hypothetical protein
LADIFGDGDNQAGGQIVTSGGGTTTFFDDVVHNGTEIRTSTGSSSVFLERSAEVVQSRAPAPIFFKAIYAPAKALPA